LKAIRNQDHEEEENILPPQGKGLFNALRMLEKLSEKESFSIVP
jgi:hypothetical protein